MADQIGSSNINKVFSGLKKKDHKAFIPFLTCGFPDPGKFYSLFEVLDRSGADIIEIGIPFSDPLADGPVIQETSKIALGNGIDTDVVFSMIEKIRGKTDTPLVILTYFNIVFKRGVERFCKEAKNAGCSGLIVPDIPLDEESQEGFMRSVKKNNLIAIRVLSPASNKRRILLNAPIAKGFVPSRPSPPP